MSAPDGVVIGGGVIGLAVARELALRGSRVILLERGEPGREASWAAAGMLSPLGEAAGRSKLLALARRSLDLWPAFAGTLQAETGLDPDYRAAGKLHVARNDREAAELEAIAAGGGEFGIHRLGPTELHTEEPALADDVTSGLRVDRDHYVNPRRLCEALRKSAAGAGVDVRTGAHVAGVTTSGPAVTGVRLADGAVVNAATVVVAAGAWSGGIEGLPARLPVRPVRGEMLAVDASTASPPGLLRRVVHGADCYIVPRAGGQLAAGATSDDVGFRPGPTAAGIARLAAAATALVPSFGRFPVIETWAGFRPGTPDDLPILGADPELRGLHYATGHFRNGILLAPATATLVADGVAGAAPDLDLASFGVQRLRAA